MFNHLPYVCFEADPDKAPQVSPIDPNSRVAELLLPSGRHDTDQKLDKKRRTLKDSQSPRVPNEPTEHGARISRESWATEDQAAASDIERKEDHPITHWIREGKWPRKYFERNMSHLQMKKRPFPIAQAQWESGITPRSTIVPTSQKDRDEKSAPYKDCQYEGLLAEQGSYMDRLSTGVTKESLELCDRLLSTEQALPSDSLFRDDLFLKTCEAVRNKNEARLVRDILPLICPSAEIQAMYDAIEPQLLIDGVNQGWSKSVPLIGPRPQPDYSVGFRTSAFTEGQLQKLSPFVGRQGDRSIFMATFFMYFPFLTCEVKGAAGDLRVADRQNAHSATLAVRGIVELSRLSKREKQLHGKILTFSISHDDQYVQIYGHYALMGESKTTFHRHPIYLFNFTTRNGKDKWTAYQFTKTVYCEHAPYLHSLICSAIDGIPSDLNPVASLFSSVKIRSELAEREAAAASDSAARASNRSRLAVEL